MAEATLKSKFGGIIMESLYQFRNVEQISFSVSSSSVLENPCNIDHDI